LRDALDRCALCGAGGRPLPSTVLSLAHDIASAMMHLHAEGIVHGDVKAANVLLTSSTSGGAERDWSRMGLLPPAFLTAKVADFGKLYGGSTSVVSSGVRMLESCHCVCGLHVMIFVLPLRSVDYRASA
jgi:serine/threonine protein kinase